MKDFEGIKILLGITGGIAAYKSTYLVRALTELGAQVRVVMTEHAKSFITPLTLQALSGFPVRTELFDGEAERAMSHIELARFADYLVIAPASANCIAKLAHGFADDLLSTLTLVAECPLIICPAMNQSMWKHPATQANCKTLTDRGVVMVGPTAGEQACGESGFGRVSEAEDIIQAIRLHSVKGLLKGKSVVITAGPTREAIDPVRYLSNRSSGKMGYALAAAAYYAGANVTLITGPSSLTSLPGINVLNGDTAISMHKAVMSALKPGDIFIGAAAVSDYRVEHIATEKIKKDKAQHLSLSLVKNKDILSDVVKTNRASYVVGFAAETHDLIQHAQDKLHAKQVDMIIANLVSDTQGFDFNDNEVTVITNDMQKSLKMMNKNRLAAELIKIIAAINQA